jgi:RNA polymerase sigma factor (sigma-70 family)
MPLEPKPDARTVERFRTLLLPHLDAAYGYARWLTRNPTDAQDVAQESLLKALRYFHSFHGEMARPWLLRIVRNTWIDFKARNQSEQISMDVLEECAAEGQNPERSALAGDRRRQVAAALAALPTELREVLVLREIEELSYRHIATVLDLPIGTVMSRIARARQRLATELKSRLERRDHGLPDL